MSKFNIYDYDEDVVMHCPTLEKAEIFLEYLDSVAKTWSDGTRYISKHFWYDYESDTCYEFLEGMHDSYQWYEDANYEILEFDDFEWDEINAMGLEPEMSFEQMFYNTIDKK